MARKDPDDPGCKTDTAAVRLKAFPSIAGVLVWREFMTHTQLQRARRLLCALHDHIHETLVSARAQHASSFHKVVGITSADTIYHIDRISEHAICAWFARHWPRAWPVELVMEGLDEKGEATTFPRGTPVARTVLKCILDPIDGTRGLMYDKRSAWILTGLAPQRGAKTHLGDIVVAAMTELPTSKQMRSDQLSAVRGRGVVATKRESAGSGRVRLRVQPSKARNFEQGFASFSRFFPEGKALLGQIEETLWRRLGLWGKDGGAKVFEDQYISTGGQLYELAVGHDRMVGDLRPKVFGKIGLKTEALCCHPYDICTALILQELGGFVERPDGRPLRDPLDTTSPVSWMGYANATLARQVRPILRRILKTL